MNVLIVEISTTESGKRRVAKGKKKWGKHEKKWDKNEKKWDKFEHKRCHPRNPEMLKKRIFWLTKKRDEFQARANAIQNQLVSEGLLPPNLVSEQQFIERKLSGISNRLEKLTLISSEIDASKDQCTDPETLPDIQPARDLSDEEKQKLLTELKEIRDNLLKSCFLATKESKISAKFARSALDSFQGDPQSEQGKKLVHEWETARLNEKENRKVLKSVLKREKEICCLLGLPCEGKMMFKKEKCHFKNHSQKKFKHHK